MIYGNPSADVYKLSNQPTFLESLFTDLSKLPLTDINSPVIKKELEQVRELGELMTKDEFVRKRYQLFDRDIYRHVYSFTFEDSDQLSIEYKELIRNLFNDVVPLVHKLKLHYQRPRPFQLAPLHQVALYPTLSYSAQCPAFPSMHACIGAIMADVCTNTFPFTIKYFRDLGDDLFHSRMHMGLCLQPDVEGGRIVAEKILKNKEFKIKYRL